MQVATIEYARNVAGLQDANSTEFEPDTPFPVIALINEWKDADGTIQVRDAQSDLGGTMRLGAQSSDVSADTLARQIYGPVVTERHRHRYEANVNYLDTLRQAGLVISALTQREQLTEIVELPTSVHPWFVGVQFHPEFKSKPTAAHPLFAGLVAAMDQRTSRATVIAGPSAQVVCLDEEELELVLGGWPNVREAFWREAQARRDQE
jgi:CTP synthase